MSEIKKRSHAPKYISVFNGIKTDILVGKYTEGDFLPSEKELMAQYAASRTTIRNAIALLKSDNLVKVSQGRGTEVLASPISPTFFNLQKSMNFMSLNISNHYKVEGEAHTTTQNSIIDTTVPDPLVAAALGIPIGEVVYRLQRVKLVNDQIFAYVISYVPCDLTPGLDQYSGIISNLYEFLEKEYQVNVSNVEDRLSTTLSGFMESKLLNVKVGAPLLLIKRKAFVGERIVDYSEKVISPDLFELVINLKRPMNQGEHESLQDYGMEI